ncbi:tRNA (N(6)-L-threonylcarbamoyladenosine(37)-C(2))-methylthiotransferase MtaB [bacterium (Candidatus Blackallbacteria) CG17_big_fil_post_rev_8_21_14_2_50_48_46]|uniref:tRNA (N(6)-L-threonylcarbamoyladenosine(37)-C(2))-methylthiotransferase n=1 Tax=bacterium (Candidatus Blackallbacteria) CG17_big_fil_post_rev_8_21_14_2_50_48_46 TaxID=2014261 RepID=A0A2M7G616_9BACT|nr:MAG: tRNA (N(6)-L-threonylcarbamoyladenosine(37)-C(2))-methylthiotransferase MtaB [bacterium (Candidatus Blackallbacteria) CG18_big_fil_WC_8_21_14_2_50_49_26]PIW17362.1 MAG: tRNA (N(6)-L-threonylcarbamoyladenosine(37)-C(2))-methylthiotransferase MtaB [bacterium (Candidatus Blackallbacteria) CG17_big_fil_post_rev_8_21_14_2_50_48_46]PIW47406.1 MAG: tRNA (N(6)-L-threonylcarbamoyladenosine(37)-C(2))-methylthiotransferase MtaB [bacterium (Candidatus Blackallbacteria) CG13_big_fil_rev_8_21_14_2_50_4
MSTAPSLKPPNPASLRSVAFLALGCRLNQAEESTYREHSLESGWKIVDYRESADIYIINTCAVTLEAERQSRQMIRQARRRNPAATVVVTGCAGRSLQGHPEMEGIADLYIPNLSKESLVEELHRFLGEAPHPQFERPFPPVHESRTTRLNLKVADGCFESCAFCIIPARRGTVRSLETDEIIKRLNLAHALGYQEVVLTAVHLGALGHEKNTHALDQLLERINSETEITAVRLSSIDPHEISPRMIEAMANSPRICRFLHIPIQSGSDTVLERMRRRDTQAGIRKTVLALKAAMPDISLTTDMIVGFPGETDQDFEASYQLMEELGIHKIHVFPFSVRPGTRAAFMKDKLPEAVIEARSQRLLELSHKQQSAWMQSWQGKTVKVLIETISKEGLGKGYTPHYLRVQVPGCSAEDHNRFLEVEVLDINPDRESVRGRRVHSASNVKR